jgi:hypothetical protein
MEKNHTDGSATSLGGIIKDIRQKAKNNSLFLSALKKLINSSNRELKMFAGSLHGMNEGVLAVMCVKEKIELKPEGFSIHDFYHNMLNAIGEGWTQRLWVKHFIEKCVDVVDTVPSTNVVPVGSLDFVGEHLWNSEVLSYLNVRPFELKDTLWTIAMLLSNETRDEQGGLRKDKSNIFFTKEAPGYEESPFIISVNWTDGCGWYVNFSTLDFVANWDKIYRVFYYSQDHTKIRFGCSIKASELPTDKKKALRIEG